MCYKFILIFSPIVIIRVGYKAYMKANCNPACIQDPAYLKLEAQLQFQDI